MKVDEINVKYLAAAMLTFIVIVAVGAYVAGIIKPTQPLPPPPTVSPTPTPTPYVPTPTPTPSPTPSPVKITLVDVTFENKDGISSKSLIVNSGEIVKAKITVSSSASANIYIMIEWVKEVPLAPDDVASTLQKLVELSTGENEVVFDGLTDTKGTGKYFVRVYYWNGNQWVRIDPWTNPISNPGRPYVEFRVGVTPTPTPTPTPYVPTPTPTLPPPPPATPTPTPSPTTPTPTPTPEKPTMSFIGVTFRDSNGNDVTNQAVITGGHVDAIVSIHASASMETYIKIEWVKEVPLAPDKVVYSTFKQVSLQAGTNNIEFTDLTDWDGTGKYFVRVYKWDGVNAQWVRIDPWTNPISNPGRPYVEFKEPSISLNNVEFEYGGVKSSSLTVSSGDTVKAHIYVYSDVAVSTFIKIEWVKNIKWWPDQVATEKQKYVTLSAVTNDIVFDGLTNTLGSGNYFVRVYRWDGSSWVRIDPWNSEDGRPSVTFQ